MQDWLQTLRDDAERSGTDVYVEFGKALEEQGLLGQRSVQTTEATGVQVTHTSSPSLLQARHAFLEAQEPERLALGQPVYDTEQLVQALSRCGDKKYSTILDMPLARRVRGMLQNAFGE